MKRIYYLLVVVLLTSIGLNAEPVSKGVASYDNIEYRIMEDDNESYCVVSYCLNRTDENVEIPEYIEYEQEKYLVKEVGYRAFFNDKIVKNIKLPDSIVKFGESAFAQCENLETMNFPENLEYIDNSALRYCEKLIVNKFPNKLKWIGDEAFAMCYSLTSLIFPPSITHIGEDNFCWSHITQLEFEDGEEELNIQNTSFCYYGLETMYIGRNIVGGTIPDINSIGSLVIGETVTDLSWIEPSNNTELYQIVSNSNFPPKIGRFTSTQYKNILLFVPETSRSNYENDANWAFFEQMESLAINYMEYELIVTPADATINVGETLEIECAIEPFLPTYLNMSVPPTGILKLDKFGVVRGVSPGEAEVTVELLLNGKKSTSKILVIQPATEISLNKTQLQLEKGETVKIFANVGPANVSDMSVTWSSSNASVASVTQEGVITALSGGECDIKATTHNGLSSICHVKVKVEPVALTFNIEETSMLVGETLSVEATFSPEDVTERKLSWKSSNPDVATVKNGIVKALNPGETEISASTVNGLTAKCHIAVTQIYVEKIELSVYDITAVIGSEIEITATVLPENATNKELQWESKDELIATVNRGIVKINGEGSTTIIVKSTDGTDVYAECSISGISSIDAILNDDMSWEVYDINGIIIDKNMSSEKIKNLSKGYYILRNAATTIKIHL